MPVNKQGGKGCKKGKNATKEDENILMIECNANDGQMFGRVLKLLGDRRFRIFCNDSRERICKLAGSIRKNDRVEIGGIVLISLRDVSLSATEIGDIISTVDSRLYGKLKKLAGINQLLFANVEQQDPAEVANRIKNMKEGDNEDLFDRDGEAEDESREGDEECAKTQVKVYSKEEIAEIEKNKIKEQLERDKKRKSKYDEDVRIEDL
jgi:initiation factor 1A